MINNIINLCLKQNVKISLKKDGNLSLEFNNKPSKELISLIKDNKILIIDYLNKKESKNITKTNKKKAQLSENQKRMWFYHNLENQKNSFNLPMTAILTGKLNISHLKFTLEKIIERHQILRTIYFEDNGEVYQEVMEDNIIDIQELEVNSENEGFELIKKETKIKFNLSKEKPIKILLIKYNNKYILSIITHHIAKDTVSTNILLNELVEIYNNKFTIEKPEIQYIDFAEWQYSESYSNIINKESKYWKSRLKDSKFLHKLPIKNIRKSSYNNEGSLIKGNIDLENVSKINEYCVEKKITQFMFHYSMLSTLLYLHNKDNLVIGSPVSGRTKEELNSLIGFFVNLLPIKTEINKTDSIENIILNNRKNIINDLDNQNISFNEIVEVINPERSSFFTPLYQIMINMQNIKIKEIELNDLKIKYIENLNNETEYDLEIIVNDNNNEYSINWLYNSFLFKEEFIEQINNEYLTLLEMFFEGLIEDLDDIMFEEVISEIKEVEYEKITEYKFIKAITEEELKIKNIWEKFIKDKEIGIMDDYFKLGGNSINAIKMISYLRKEEFNIKPEEFFDNPTIKFIIENNNNNLIESHINNIAEDDEDLIEF
jgi:hypothetical protein